MFPISPAKPLVQDLFLLAGGEPRIGVHSVVMQCRLCRLAPASLARHHTLQGKCVARQGIAKGSALQPCRPRSRPRRVVHCNRKLAQTCFGHGTCVSLSQGNSCSRMVRLFCLARFATSVLRAPFAGIPARHVRACFTSLLLSFAKLPQARPPGDGSGMSKLLRSHRGIPTVAMLRC